MEGLDQNPRVQHIKNIQWDKTLMNQNRVQHNKKQTKLENILMKHKTRNILMVKKVISLITLR